MNKLPLEEFYKENETLIHFASQKALKRFLASGLGGRIEYDEIFGELREVFIKSYNQYDPEQSKFSTYFVTACQNKVTNQIEKMYRIEINLDSFEEMAVNAGDDESSISVMDSILKDAPMFEDQVELESELNYLIQGLSPFAQVLLMYSANPPKFVIDEFHAQRAQCLIASSFGFKTSHSKEVNLRFIANCLKSTTDNPEIVKCIDKAIDEVKDAVQKSVSA